MGKSIRSTIRVAIALVFLYSAYGKATHPLDTGTLYGSLVKDLAYGHQLAVSGEILLGLWLLSGLWPRSAALVTLALLGIFTGLLAAERASPHPRICACKGADAIRRNIEEIRTELGWGIARNTLMIAGGLILLVRKPRPAIPLNGLPVDEASRLVPAQ